MTEEFKRSASLVLMGICALSIAIVCQSSSPAEGERSLAEALTSSPSPSPLTLAPNRFDAGDQAFKERRDETRARAALAIYRELYAKNPQDWEAGWHVAMACYYIGIRMTKEDRDREKLYAEGRDAGQASIRLGPQKCAACSFWTAIDMALYGQTVGVFKMLFSLTEIRRDLELSVAADPAYAYSGAYRLLGKIYEKVPGIFGGSNSKAKDYYQKAIDTSPQEPLNYLFLARLLKDELDDPKAGLQTAETALKTIAPPTSDRVEAVDAMVDLKNFIENTKTSAK